MKSTRAYIFSVIPGFRMEFRESSVMNCLMMFRLFSAARVMDTDLQKKTIFLQESSTAVFAGSR